MQQKHTILVVDDDRTELDIMSNVLSSAGFRVLIAEDGESGFNRALFARPDLILLDVMMPGIDGYETCRMLRENKHTKDIPIFFKTCLGSGQSIIKGFRAGVDSHITKPCNHDKLLCQVKSRLALIQSDHLKTRFQVLDRSAL